MTGAWQLLREWPPGYGGVERVAHELASAWTAQGEKAVVFSLQPREQALDPLPVSYTRVALPSITLGRLLIPWPSRALVRLLLSSDPLHAHLPCPTVLMLSLIARGLRPRRWISVHWHSFVEGAPTLSGRAFRLYQALAERSLVCFNRIVTTSPVLQRALIQAGAPAEAVRVLPCCLPSSVEQESPIVTVVKPSHHFRLISIGRLDSYKRVDWLIEALVLAQRQLHFSGISLSLDVVGDGPDRGVLMQQAHVVAPGRVRFFGRLDELAKRQQLAQADALVLAADRCHEAFGIVQLEAMRAGVPALAFDLPRSGMAWVSQLPCLRWSHQRDGLPALIVRLAQNPRLLALARRQAQQRYEQVFSRRVWLIQLAQAFRA